MPNAHNRRLLTVLFTLAHWHALAKLRQHTDLSLSILDAVTTQLGKSLKDFQAKTCSAYDTRELKREVAARLRKTKKVSSDKSSLPLDRLSANSQTTPAQSTVSAPCSLSKPNPEKVTSSTAKISGRRFKKLNLNTYKDHSLGDYVETIRRNGTVDSYSTESVNYIPSYQ